MLRLPPNPADLLEDSHGGIVAFYCRETLSKSKNVSPDDTAYWLSATLMDCLTMRPYAE